MTEFIRTQPKPTCALCGGVGERIHAGLRDRLFGAPGEWNIAQCQNSACGFAWLDPAPIEVDIHKAYQRYYTHQEGEGQKSFSRGLLSSGFRALIKAATHLFGLTRQHNDLENMHLVEIPTGRLLDIGCVAGAFLHKMKVKWWSVEGLDFDAEAVRAAFNSYGVNAKVGRLEDAAYAPDSFDVITMHHVIEHVFQPVDLLCEIHRILKPGGALIAITPNINSWGHKRFGKNWRGLEPPRHVSLFNPSALATASKVAKFYQVNVYSTAANSWSIFASSIAAHDAAIKTNTKPRAIGPIIKLRALVLQCCEAWLNRGGRDVGEVCVLVARK